ncbi:MAG: XRE family transcriptional regulator [Gemmatimonadetes bacterium]|nr:XRE family transcriptional regulator [Gemmatimonadota bacterium]
MPSNRNQSIRIGTRLKAARERAGLTQQQLAAELGLEHRQTVGTIEAGERRMTAAELVRAVEVLGVDLDYFTDSFRLVGEARFSFRTAADGPEDLLDQFEERAGRWIATYRELGVQQGEEPRWLEPKLALTAHSSFEEAQAAGEAIVSRWKLGVPPADALRDAIERELGALVLYVDAPAGLSGAASRLPGLNTVLVNRQEPEGRRNYDLAHELFHLLTWDAMPPERVEPVEVARGGKGKRVEHLAENFAAALLMPSALVESKWSARDPSADLHAVLNAIAVDLRVSATACKWRLHNLGLLSKADLEEIDDRRLVANGRPRDAAAPVPRFSLRFVQRIAEALDAGRLSVKRAASLLSLTLSELAQLLEEHGIEPSFEAPGR